MNSSLEILTGLGARVLPSANKLIKSPPGDLILKKGTKNFIVATLPRIGTHLLIDFLIANTLHYRNPPLYVNVDNFFISSGKQELLDARSQIAEGAGLLLKTHYPFFNHDEQSERFFDSLINAGNTVVLGIKRNITNVKQSLDTHANFYYGDEAFESNLKIFQSFWDSRIGYSVVFDELVQKDPSAVRPISNLVSLKAEPFIFQRDKKERLRIYLDKTLTRILGNAAPKINTSIGFGLKSQQSKDKVVWIKTLD